MPIYYLEKFEIFKEYEKKVYSEIVLQTFKRKNFKNFSPQFNARLEIPVNKIS